MKLNNQQLSVLPELPIDIEFLDISFNNLKTINLTKYNKLKYLNCSNNLLTELIINDINILICKNNYLQTLNLQSVIELDCSYNSLSTLNIIDTRKLKKIIVNDNKLNKLFFLPITVFDTIDTIEYLNINNNYLQYYELIDYDKYNDFQKLILNLQLTTQLQQPIQQTTPQVSDSALENQNNLICENNKLYNHLNFIDKGIIILVNNKSTNKIICFCYTFEEINKLDFLNYVDYKLNSNDKLLLQIFNTFVVSNNQLKPINLNNFINKNIVNTNFIPEIQDLILNNIKIISTNNLLFTGYTKNNNFIKIYKNPTDSLTHSVLHKNSESIYIMFDDLLIKP